MLGFVTTESSFYRKVGILSIIEQLVTAQEVNLSASLYGNMDKCFIHS